MKIFTTKTAEGSFSEKSSCGFKKKMGERSEMMKKKHTMEYVKLLKE